jgi:peptidylprolyl isomerase
VRARALLLLCCACGPAVGHVVPPVENRAEPVTSPSAQPAAPEVDAVGLEAPADLTAPPDDAERRPSGLVTRVLRRGRAGVRARPDDTVVVHYSLWTQDGALVDSSVQRKQVARFKPNQTVLGFSEGVQLMEVGEIRRLWVPEALAYQGQRLPGVLVFDIELIAIEPGGP